MVLSKRLQAVADMVTPGNVAADVGCDHGYVPIALIQRQVCPHVIALDTNKGPLLRAGEHIAAYRMTDYIETRLSDGTAALQRGEADTLICAGMGGRLILRILEQGRAVVSAMQEWILQPQSETARVRAYIRERGYAVRDECMIYEDGKYYPIIKVCLTQANQSGVGLPEKLTDQFGPILLQKKDAVLYQYLLEQQAKYEAIRAALQREEPSAHNGEDRKQKRIAQIEEALRDVRTVIGGVYEVQ